MRALVTGHRGFLGRHFYQKLLAEGWSVVGADIRNRRPIDANELFRHPETLPQPFDLVVHCAAYAPHRSAIDSRPLHVATNNLELDQGLFNWASRAQPGRVLYFSSSAAYPTYMQNDVTSDRLLTESDQLVKDQTIGQPDGAYGWVKLTGEKLANWYLAGGGPVTVIRPFSGYGSDQSYDFPFGAMRDRALNRTDPFVIWGDGNQIRDWVHVDDVVAGSLALANHGIDGPVNMCTGLGTSMNELAQMFCDQVGYRPKFEHRVSAPTGVARRVGDPKLLRKTYEPVVSLETGVSRALKLE